MKSLANISLCLLTGALAVSAISTAAKPDKGKWEIGAPVFSQGPAGSFDEVSVKDPSIVFFEGKWRLFFTACSKSEYVTGYAAAAKLTDLNSAPRHELTMIRGRSRYGCAPQIFHFTPQKKWYLIHQNRDSNYQPMFSTTATIDKPESWSIPQKLIEKDHRSKWIDFWVICDDKKAYLFYTQGHNGVIVRSTGIDRFPSGWGPAKEVLRNIHEAVHIYKVKDRREFHMIYELNKRNVRSFGIATATKLEGPWKRVTDRYATGDQLKWAGGVKPWTEMVSHGELLRAGYDEKMEYEPKNCRWLIQGVMKKDTNVSYPSLPWKLGVMRKVQ